MSKTKTVALKIVGLLRESDRTHLHSIDKPADLNFSSLIQPVGGGAKRSLKSCIVEILAEVRDGTGLYPGTTRGAGTSEACAWLEWFDYLKPLHLLMEDHFRGHVIYEVTPKGHEFLAKHEAPVEW